MKKCFALVRTISSDIWDNMRDGALIFTRNSAVLLLAETFRTIARLFLEHPASSSTYSADVGRMIDRLEAFIQSGSRERVGEQALMVLIES